MMVLAGIENLIVFLVIGAFIVIPSIIKAVRQAKEQAERNARSGRGESGGERKPKASSSTDELTAFLNSLSQKTSVGRPARRPPAKKPARLPEREARPARITAEPKPLHPATPIADARVPSGPKRIPKRKRRQQTPVKVAAATRVLVPVRDRAREAEERLAPVAVVPEQRAPVKTFRGRLPADPLQQAIVLREVLGPCRCRRRYRPGEW